MKKKKLVAKVRALEALISNLSILEQDDFRRAEESLEELAFLDEGSFDGAAKGAAEAKTELETLEIVHLSDSWHKELLAEQAFESN